MTTKVNQTVIPGIWVERDTSLLLVTGDFSAPLWALPESDVYNVFNILQTRCTIIGANPNAAGTSASFIVGHAGGAFDTAVVAELNAQLAIVGAYVLSVGTIFTVS